MGRRRNKPLIEAMSSWPWPLNIALGVAGFAALHWGAPLWRAQATSLYTKAVLDVAAIPLLAWGWLALCSIAALASHAAARRRSRLLDTRTTLQSLSDTGWRNFERLVGEAFRRQGYAVEETGLGGADGGIDLILRRDGRRVLVQCKQWKRQQVGVSVVREMYGLMAHHQADAVQIVSTGRFTRDAQTFAHGKAITLIPGEALLDMIRAVQTTAPAPAARIEPQLPVQTRSPPAATAAPTCPRCGADMTQRNNRQTRDPFLGCTRYPLCKGTRPHPEH